MSEHTKEPWKVEESTDGRSGVHVRGGDIASGARVPRSIARLTKRASWKETHANARHIVSCVNHCAGLNPEAIPALLQALETIGSYTGEGSVGTPWREIVTHLGCTARAALAAARGEK